MCRYERTLHFDFTKIKPKTSEKDPVSDKQNTSPQERLWLHIVNREEGLGCTEEWEA